MGAGTSKSLYATAGMSPGVLNDLMKRLEAVYEECLYYDILILREKKRSLN